MPQVEGARGGVAYGWRDGGLHRSNSLKESIYPHKDFNCRFNGCKAFWQHWDHLSGWILVIFLCIFQKIGTLLNFSSHFEYLMFLLFGRVQHKFVVLCV